MLSCRRTRACLVGAPLAGTHERADTIPRRGGLPLQTRRFPVSECSPERVLFLSTKTKTELTSLSMSDCVFCKIIEGKLPARKVYEDALAVAFWDARPASPVHILIVPRQHIPTLNDVDENDQIVNHLSRVAKKIAEDLGIAQTGYRFFINVNRGGGQMVFHLHAHLVAGNDMGTFFIKIGIACAVLWRKLVHLVRPEQKRNGLRNICGADTGARSNM